MDSLKALSDMAWTTGAPRRNDTERISGDKKTGLFAKRMIVATIINTIFNEKGAR
jgi:hypothetical protein